MKLRQRNPVGRADENCGVDHPVMEGRAEQERLSQRHREAAGNPLHEHLGSPPPVCCLCLPVSPAAILGTVGTVVVDPIKRHAGRGLPHVGDEVLERLPSLAYPYSPPAVVFEGLVVGVSAPLPHAAPCAIQFRVRRTVRRVHGNCQFAHKATARRGVSCSKVADGCLNLVSANATAAPSDAILIGPVTFGNDRKAAEDVSLQVQFSHPSIVRNNARGINV